MEDIVLPMLEKDQEKLSEAAGEFVDTSFQWNTDDNGNLKRKIAETAKRKKAIMTAAGQRKKPGGSMNVILDQSKLISSDTFTNNEDVRAFADFVVTLTGIS
ncbi:MAG: hypothetical protein GY862_16760 [Gammaproteobacteria bacterium]|nr:hypothetical protein [Gammaproteobacteria bacterium]